MPVSTQEAGAGDSLQVQGQSGLKREFQDRQSCYGKSTSLYDNSRKLKLSNGF